MNKTWHRLFQKKKLGKGAGQGNPPDAPPPGPSPAPAAPAKAEAAALRLDAADSAASPPLRLGSPSSSEATVKRLAQRLFSPQSNLALARPPLPPGAPGPAPRPRAVATEVLAFEVGSIMRRMLEIHDSCAEKTLSSLRSNLQAPGVVTLIANDVRVLWGLAGYEKQQELGAVAHRVAVLGRKCGDQRLRKLAVLFDELQNPEANFSEYSATTEEADVLVSFMRDQADATDKLKAEMESIQLLHTRIQEYGEWNSLQEMVTQGKLVEKLQGHCLWSYNLDYLVQVLVIAVLSLRKRIFGSFGSCLCPDAIKSASLGAAGLALHYANIVVLLERIIQQPDTVLGPTRDELYSMLPRSIQFLLRLQLQNPANFMADGRIEANLKRGLLLLPTMAHNTIHWHTLHTPGATQDSSEVVFQIQTFYYADRQAVNAALVDVLLGLCRICGVESPIQLSTRQSSSASDQKQAMCRLLQEEQEEFRKSLRIEERENQFGGEVLRTVDSSAKEGHLNTEGGAAQGHMAAGSGPHTSGASTNAEMPSTSQGTAAGSGIQAGEQGNDTQPSPGQGTAVGTDSAATVQQQGQGAVTTLSGSVSTGMGNAASGGDARRQETSESESMLRKKAYSQLFSRSSSARTLGTGTALKGSTLMSEKGRGAAAEVLEIPRGRRGVARGDGEPHPWLFRRALPPCFAPTDDSDSEGEEDPASAGQARPSRRRGGRRMGLLADAGVQDVARRTKHYHSQPVNLGRQRHDNMSIPG